MSRSPEPTSVFSRIRRDRSASPRRRQGDKRRSEGYVFHRLGVEEEVCPHTQKAATRVPIHEERSCSQKLKTMKGDIGSQGRENKSQASKRKIYLNHGHARKQTPSPFESATLTAAKLEQWAMPTWCHMFNSTLTESARQKKCIKDPVEIHHIKQREWESIEDFVQRFKAESRHVKGAPECMRISEFMHGIRNPELIKSLHDNIPKSMDEMLRVTTSFLIGKVASSNQARKKTLPAWKQQETGRKQNFDRRGDFRNQQRS
ncbi:hypothetical protein Tco_1428949 [Tanacetum coccineum]